MCISLFGVLEYLEWCEQCVFTDGQGRHDSAHSAHDKFTKYWGRRRQRAAVERAVFASVLQHHLNYELIKREKRKKKTDELLISSGALEANALIIGWVMEEGTETRCVTLKPHLRI